MQQKADLRVRLSCFCTGSLLSYVLLISSLFVSTKCILSLFIPSLCIPSLCVSLLCISSLCISLLFILLLFIFMQLFVALKFYLQFTDFSLCFLFYATFCCASDPADLCSLFLDHVYLETLLRVRNPCCRTEFFTLRFYLFTPHAVLHSKCPADKMAAV